MIKSHTILAAMAVLVITASSCNNSDKTASNGTKQDSTATTAKKDTTANPGMNADGTAGKMVGGAAMVDTKDIVDNAVGSKDHTTLVAAVKQAGLVETLKGPGPFTVFAPTNEAFDKVGKDKIAALMTDAEKPTLTKILTYHVVAGKLKIADMTPGAPIHTVEGGTLMLVMKDGKPYIQDETGAMAAITIQDVMDKNGVTHVIDGVLMPNMSKDKKAGK